MEKSSSGIYLLRNYFGKGPDTGFFFFLFDLTFILKLFSISPFSPFSFLISPSSEGQLLLSALTLVLPVLFLPPLIQQFVSGRNEKEKKEGKRGKGILWRGYHVNTNKQAIFKTFRWKKKSIHYDDFFIQTIEFFVLICSFFFSFPFLFFFFSFSPLFIHFHPFPVPLHPPNPHL